MKWKILFLISRKNWFFIRINKMIFYYHPVEGTNENTIFKIIANYEKLI